MIAMLTKKPKILVIGDLMIDQYLWGDTSRISPEAPVQVVNIKKESTLLGGAGNVISNLKKFGAKVDILSVIGNCEVAVELNHLLKNIDINTKYLVLQEGRITSKKSRIISSQQQVIRFDRESIEEINSDTEKKMITIFKKIVKSYEIILVSDYGKGVLTAELTQSLISIANINNKKVLIDPKGKNYLKYKDAFLLTPNKKEASEATNIDIQDDNSLIKAIVQLKKQCNLKVSLITLSGRGIATYENELVVQPTTSKEVFDVTGAGDTVLASLGFALSCGYDITEAVRFANLAAGVVVGKIGSATTSINEIIEYESSLNISSGAKKIKTLSEISIISKKLRKENKKIVFTNGCFDLLHAGHVKYLEAAKNFGDILIIGLNSDSSVTSLKGKERPINTQKDRCIILSALKVVDYVVIFEALSPYELIKIINPHLLVKGGDYEEVQVIGKDLVDEIKIIEFTKGHSTSNIINKIKG